MFQIIGPLALCIFLLSDLGNVAAVDENMSYVEICRRMEELFAKLGQSPGVPRNNYTGLVECYQEAAEQGYAEAQYYLGFMYWYGRYGIPQSTDEAVKWYLEAAEQGHIEAQYTLGQAYGLGQHDFGVGIPRDAIEAVKWYRQAAEQGHASAQYNLGRMYDDGEGVPEDDVQAYAWLNIAAAQGSLFAKERKQRIAESINREEIARAQKLAREYWQRYVLPFRN